MHGSVHELPAGHSTERPPLHSILHAVAPPHVILQLAEPSHFAVQPPPGQPTSHVLLPVQSMVEPAPSVTLHVLPPAQSTVLFVPAE